VWHALRRLLTAVGNMEHNWHSAAWKAKVDRVATAFNLLHP
jgi:hypothetical protein